MVRIASGTAKNINLYMPAIPNFRAVQEVVRHSLFSIIGERIHGAVCLDLYAGSGSLGIEALSRGAAWCDFVDINYVAKQMIQKNLQKCSFTEKSEIITKDALKYVASTTKQYDFIFIDPFYKITAHRHLFKTLHKIIKQQGWIIFMHGDALPIQELVINTQLSVITRKKFGKGCFTILRPFDIVNSTNSVGTAQTSSN